MPLFSGRFVIDAPINIRNSTHHSQEQDQVLLRERKHRVIATGRKTRVLDIYAGQNLLCDAYMLSKTLPCNRALSVSTTRFLFSTTLGIMKASGDEQHTCGTVTEQVRSGGPRVARSSALWWRGDKVCLAREF